MKLVLLSATINLLLLPAMASAQPAKIAATPSGNVLQAPDGKTLYVYDGDKVTLGHRGKSSCDNECARRWPPFSAGLDAQPIGNWNIIVREDGSRQWAYKGRPLYTWSEDTEPGETKGDGSDGNSWHIAKP